MKAITACIHSSESQRSSSKAHSFSLASYNKSRDESRINCLDNSRDCKMNKKKKDESPFEG